MAGRHDRLRARRCELPSKMARRSPCVCRHQSPDLRIGMRRPDADRFRAGDTRPSGPRAARVHMAGPLRSRQALQRLAGEFEGDDAVLRAISGSCSDTSDIVMLM